MYSNYKISITTTELNRILKDDLEYSKAEINSMSLDEKIENFVEAGYFEDDDEFFGIADTPVENCIDFPVVADVTGSPVSLESYFALKDQ